MCLGVFGDRQGTVKVIPDPLWAVVVINAENATSRRAASISEVNKLSAPLVHYITSPLIPELGLLGCTEGHRRAYEWVAQQPDTMEFAMVVEDDVEFVTEAYAVKRFLALSSIMPRLDRYPLIKMYFDNQMSAEKPVVPPGPVYTDVCRCTGHLTSTAATVVKRTYADYLQRLYAVSVPDAISNYFDRKHPMWHYDADVIQTNIQEGHGHGAWCPDEHPEEYGFRNYIRLSPLSQNSMNTKGGDAPDKNVTRAYLESAVREL